MRKKIGLVNRTYGQSEVTAWNTERCPIDRDRCVRGSAKSLYACT